MFDVDELISNCREAVNGENSLLAVRDVLAEALSDRAAVAAALPVTRAELTPLYAGTDVTIMKVVWAPAMTIAPHDHHMWACIGIYGGGEVNRLYRRAGDTIVESGGFDIDEGEIGLLGDDAIHSVTNPLSHQYTAAIHIYGGDFLNVGRSSWVGDPMVEEPTDTEKTRLLFEEANRAL